MQCRTVIQAKHLTVYPYTDSIPWRVAPRTFREHSSGTLCTQSLPSQGSRLFLSPKRDNSSYFVFLWQNSLQSGCMGHNPSSIHAWSAPCMRTGLTMSEAWGRGFFWLNPWLVGPMHYGGKYNIKNMRERSLLFSTAMEKREREEVNLQRDTHWPTFCIKESPPRVSRISQTGTTIWIPVKGIFYSKYNKD